MGVHHAWGRTLKDVFQRYHALRGFDQRYQNGFDCQGLWVEVEVEKELGLNSKREIEDYGLDNFSAPVPRACRAVQRGAYPSSRSASASGWTGQRLLHVRDTNIEYIWRFLKVVPREGLALRRATRRCRGARAAARPLAARAARLLPDRTDPSLFVRFPLRGPATARRSSSGRRRPGRCPPTSRPPSNPDGDYGRLAERRDWVAVARFPERDVRRVAPRAPSWSGAPTRARSTTCPPQQGVEHRVVPWDEVSPRRGHRHRPHRPRLRRRGLRARRRSKDCRSSCRSTRRDFLDGFGELYRLSTADAEDRDRRPAAARALVQDREIEHRYPTAGAARRALIFRLADEWFIRADEVRASLIDANRRPSSGRPTTSASGWTTGSTTWATGASRASATGACRCRSTRVSAAT